MSTHKDIYHYQQASPVGQAGFELFHSDEHKAWFFHCNDLQGQPLLFSQAYTQADAAQKGMASVWKNMAKLSKIEAVGKVWQIIVKAGNHQELARSRQLATREVAQQQLDYLRKVAKSAQPLAAAPEKAKAAEAPLAAPMPDARHAFKLYFYPSSEEGQLDGRIENTKTREQAAFKGIDTAAIGRFLHQAMPQSTVLATDTPTQDAIVGHLSFGEAPEAKSFHLGMRGDALDLCILLPHTDTLPQDHRILSSQLQIVDKQSGIVQYIAVQTTDSGASGQLLHLNATLPQDVEQGTYQLLADTQLYTPHGLKNVSGTALLQVV